MLLLAFSTSCLNRYQCLPDSLTSHFLLGRSTEERIRGNGFSCRVACCFSAGPTVTASCLQLCFISEFLSFILRMLVMFLSVSVDMYKHDSANWVCPAVSQSFDTGQSVSCCWFAIMIPTWRLLNVSLVKSKRS